MQALIYLVASVSLLGRRDIDFRDRDGACVDDRPDGNTIGGPLLPPDGARDGERSCRRVLEHDLDGTALNVGAAR